MSQRRQTETTTAELKETLSARCERRSGNRRLPDVSDLSTSYSSVDSHLTSLRSKRTGSLFTSSSRGRVSGYGGVRCGDPGTHSCPQHDSAFSCAKERTDDHGPRWCRLFTPHSAREFAHSYILPWRLRPRPFAGHLTHLIHLHAAATDDRSNTILECFNFSLQEEVEALVTKTIHIQR